MNVDTKKGATTSQPLSGFRPKPSGFGKQLDSFKAIRKAILEDSASVEDSAGASSRSGKFISTAIYKGKPQDFHKLRDDNLRKGTLFEDPEFPAVLTSLWIGSIPDDEKPTFDKMVWLRPKEIVKAPQLFVNGYTRFDVIQGRLGDCWAVAAMATLTQQPHLFKNVINDDDQSFENKYAGIFHFRFWEYGKWVDIVIDDRLPIYNGKLIYAHSQEDNEFWIALLEKAYAKFYGSYEALIAGFGEDAMQDFTGGVPEEFSIVDLKKKYQNNLFRIIRDTFERGSLITAEIRVTDLEEQQKLKSLGLIALHSYSVSSMMYIQTSKAKEKIPLIRMRNPWGDETEWNGPWCDNSKEWNDVSEDVKKQIGLTFDKDGEFWMKWDDFQTYFTDLNFCNLTLDSLSKAEISGGYKKRWEVSMVKGAWVKGVSAGGLMDDHTNFQNPQYRITLTRSDENGPDSNCTLIVSLMQKHRRTMIPRGDKFNKIGFLILHIENPDSSPNPLTESALNLCKTMIFSHIIAEIAVVTSRFDLPPGTYCIMPFTLNANEEGSFILRIFSETKNYMGVYDETVGLGEIDKPILEISARMGGIEEPDVNKDVQQMFWKLADANLEVHWMELKQILDFFLKEETKNKGFTEDACRNILSISDKDHSGKLDYQEFTKLWIDLKMWKKAFKTHDKDNSGTLGGFEIRKALNSAGFRVNNLILIDFVHRYGNAERKLNFEAYILCAIKIKTLIELFNSKTSDQSKTASFTLPELLQNTLHY